MVGVPALGRNLLRTGQNVSDRKLAVTASPARVRRPLPALTAYGELFAAAPWQVKQSERFQPVRREARSFEPRNAPIRRLPL